MKQAFRAVILLATLGLVAGCGVELVSPGGTDSAQPSAIAEPPGSASPSAEAEPSDLPSGEAEASASPSAQAEPSADETTDDPSSTESTSADRKSTRRSEHLSSVDVTMGCPTGEVVVEETLQTVKITESCKKVIVRSPLAIVLAEHVDTVVIELSASGALVLVRSANAVRVGGALSAVYWDEGRPSSVKVTGSLAKAKPNPTPEK